MKIPDIIEKIKMDYMWAALRLGLGWIMLWAFLDKTFGLGFATAPENAWIKGVSPTSGFLTFGTGGFFGDFFQGLAGNVFVDWLFMIGLLMIGVAVTLGVGMRVAGYAGALFMLLLYLSNIPPANNPLIDDHIIYMILFVALAKVRAGQWVGLGKWWANTALVKRFPFLE